MYTHHLLSNNNSTANATNRVFSQLEPRFQAIIIESITMQSL